MRYFLIFILLHLSNPTIYAQKIGVVDFNAILLSMPETKFADAEVAKLKKEYQSLLIIKKQEFENKYKKYDSSFAKMSIDIQEIQKKDLANLQNDYQSLLLKADSTVKSKSNILILPIIKKLNDAISVVSKSKNLSNVWDSQTQGLVYFQEGINISNEVRKYLKLN